MKINNVELYESHNEKVAQLDISYPTNNQIDTIQVGLIDVRAADEIQIKYDFERDGWAISQPREYNGNDGDLEIEWIETAFCPAWQYELTEEEKVTYKPKKVEA